MKAIVKILVISMTLYFGGLSSDAKAQITCADILRLKTSDVMKLRFEYLSHLVREDKFDLDGALRLNLEIRKFFRQPQYSDSAALLMMQFRHQLRRLPENSILSYFGSKDLVFKEDQRIMEILAASPEQREAMGEVERRVLETPMGSYELKIQPEFERRIQLPSEPYTVEIPIPYMRYPRSVSITDSASLVNALLWRHYSQGRATPSDRSTEPILSFRPLHSQKDHFHSGQKISQKEDVEGTSFSRVITNKIPLGSENDRISLDYIVTHQREIGTYFDTPAKDLWKQKIALRIKEFRSLKNDTAGEGTLILFAKKTADSNQKDLFTQRQEYEVKLPPNPTPQQIRDVQATLLQQLGVDKKVVDRLTQIESIDNERYGFDLIWRNTLKIGFVTIDSFRSAVADSRRADQPSFRQWEVEILPEFTFLKDLYPEEFKKFFGELESSMHGKLNPTPKAHQHSL